MKNIINFFIPLLLLLTPLSSATGQSNNAFIFLPDLTGYPAPEQHLQDDLEDAATALRMALDSIYRPDFAVYDMGFYAHHPNMVGGIPEVMADAISDRITHPYYLFFAREMDDQGDLKKVWVEMELPNTAEFCYWEDGTFSHLKFMVDFRANAAKGLSMSNPGPIFDAMKNGINYMSDRVAQLVECCSSAARQSCDCGWSFDAIESLISRRDFFEVEAEVIPSQVVNTACPCFDDPEIISNSIEGSNYEVISKVTFDSIKFAENKVIAVSDLFETLKEMGKQFEELYEGKFFAAITDQYAFCNKEGNINALRMQSFDYDPYINDRMMFDGEKNMAIWVNVTYNGDQATVSIKGGGNIPFNFTSAIAKFYGCWMTTDDWTAYTTCAINHILFSGQVIVERADDLVIKGKNNTSATVINDVLKISVQTGLDFGGEHVIADLSNQIFGIQNSASKGGSAYISVRHGTHLNAILFLSGDYAGYWYYYSSIFGRAGYYYGSFVNYTFDFERSFLYGWTDDEKFNTPKFFRGSYIGILASGDIGVYKGIVGVGISGGVNLSYVKDLEEEENPNWTVLQGGYGVSLGPGNAGMAFALNGEIGEVLLISEQVKTNQRSSTSIIANWILTLTIM